MATVALSKGGVGMGGPLAIFQGRAVLVHGVQRPESWGEGHFGIVLTCNKNKQNHR